MALTSYETLGFESFDNTTFPILMLWHILGLST
jgi:hypothetical protein